MKVGQKVLLLWRGKEFKVSTIEKVGKKYIHIAGCDTSFNKGEYSAGGYTIFNDVSHYLAFMGKHYVRSKVIKEIGGRLDLGTRTHVHLATLMNLAILLGVHDDIIEYLTKLYNVVEVQTGVVEGVVSPQVTHSLSEYNITLNL